MVEVLVFSLDMSLPDHGPCWCRLTFWLDLVPDVSPWTCLVVAGNCLTLVTITGPDPELWTDVLSWCWTCFITMTLSNGLDPVLPLHSHACPACLEPWGGLWLVRIQPCWLSHPLGSWSKEVAGLRCALMWSLELATVQSLLLWKRERTEKAGGCGSIHSLYTCCRSPCPWRAGRGTEIPLKSAADGSLLQTSALSRILQPSLQKSQLHRLKPFQWRAWALWRQCQTSHFWVSPRGRCRARPRYMELLERHQCKSVAVSSWFPSSCQLCRSFWFLQRQAVTSHLNSEGGSRSPSRFLAACQPLIRGRKIYSGMSPSVSCQPPHQATNEEWKRPVQFLCHAPPPWSVLPHTSAQLSCSSSPAGK